MAKMVPCVCASICIPLGTYMGKLMKILVLLGDLVSKIWVRIFHILVLSMGINRLLWDAPCSSEHLRAKACLFQSVQGPLTFLTERINPQTSA